MRFGEWIARRTSWNRRHGGDEGQVGILLVGFVVVAVALVTVVTAATSVHLARTRLADLADLAALDAADAVARAAYYAPDGTVALADEGVAATVDAYLAAHPDAAVGDVRVLAATSPDGRTAQVRLGAVLRPAWVAWLPAPFGDGIALEASSSARAW